MSRFEAKLAGASYGRLQVLGGIDVSVQQGEMLVVLGSNGAGKTTALRAILGTVASTGRRLALDGVDVSALQPWRLPAIGVSLVPDGARCFPNLTVLDNLRGAHMAASGVRSMPEPPRLLQSVYGYFPVLRDRQAQIAGTMSGGQRQMLAIGRALMTAPRVLLLDEPSAGLAPRIVEELFVTLAEIKHNSGCAIVMAEQNVGYATRIADHCLVLEEGHVTLAGPMAEIARRDELATAYLGL
jgi:branched-chain amino acid transport system ATP-binding protein